jgi:hypothetical protein
MVARLLFRLIVTGSLCAGTAASAFDLGNRAPDPAPKYEYQSRVLVRQGGDTMATATPITSLPYVGSGTTVGFADDYDAVCPNTGSDSPDVVYSFTRPQYGTLTIDLCGSDFDTKVYVMSEEGQIFDCNDDYYFDGNCGQQTSRIDNLWLPPGETYYLVIDGAGGAAGNYEFEMRRWDNDPPGNGDTTLDPFVIDGLPYTSSGTTAGYTNDYDSVCPYTGSTAPDVVYKYVATAAVTVDIDLCLSSYDTKLYVYDSAMNVIACNDDFYSGAPCFNYSSFLGQVPFAAGQTYYIVVDGYAASSGAYHLDVAGYMPCVFECVDGVDEGEPDMHDEYLDLQNGGCNSPNLMFQFLYADHSGDLTLCANSGWYFYTGLNYRDTDWFAVIVGHTGEVEMEYFGEQAMFMFDLSTGLTCPAGGVAGPTSGVCPVTYTLTGPPGSVRTFVMLPPAWTPQTQTFHYRLNLSGLQAGSVATEATTWGTLKALYR